MSMTPRGINRDEEEPMKRTSDLGKTSAASLLGEQDLYLFNEGTHRGLAAKMGAHLVPSYEGSGASFAVWAPNAAQVSVIGDFNGWRGDQDRLSPRGSSGIWGATGAGVERGQVYKYEIRPRQGERLEKADPFATRCEVPPRTGSVIWSLDYQWEDAEWMRRRGEANSRHAPLSICELHLGSWLRDPGDAARLLS